MARKVITGKRVWRASKIVLEDGTELPIDLRILAYIPRKVDREPYVKVYQDAIGELLIKGEISKSAFKVLLWFIKNTNWENDWIAIDYEELAEELHLKTDTIRKAVKQLINYGLIIQQKPYRSIFRLNPRYIYKGGVVGKLEDIDF
jgi:hypothetical protein